MTVSQAAAQRDLAALQKEARAELWRRGALEYKLDPNQRGIWSQISSLPLDVRRFVIEAGRRIGKSYMLAVISLIMVLRQKGRVIYAAPTQREGREILGPLVSMICDDAPDDCRPTWRSQDGHLMVPSRGEIVLVGCDDRAQIDRIRGTECMFAVVDEAGFVGELEYLLRGVLNPATLNTGGKTILSSTPPPTPGHAFAKIAEAARISGAYAHRTVYQSGTLRPEQVEAYVRSEATDAGLTVEEFRKTTDYRREFMAERVIDGSRAVIPEWTREKEDETIVEIPRPELFDPYEGMDPGYQVDPTGVLFGYYHFARAAVVVEDELLLPKETTRGIVEAIQAKERLLWPVTGKKPRTDSRPATMSSHYGAPLVPTGAWEPYLRVSDSEHRLVADMQREHGMTFQVTLKNDLKAQVNKVRMWLNAGRILIHPRCRSLMRHIREALWNKTGMQFERVGGHHADLLMALVYMTRNIHEENNPFPRDYQFDPANQFDYAGHLETQREDEQLQKLFEIPEQDEIVSEEDLFRLF